MGLFKCTICSKESRSLSLCYILLSPEIEDGIWADLCPDCLEMVKLVTHATGGFILDGPPVDRQELEDIATSDN